MVKKLT